MTSVNDTGDEVAGGSEKEEKKKESNDETKEASGDATKTADKEEGACLGASGASGDDNAVEVIRKYLAEKLGFYSPDKVDKPKPKILDELTIDGIANYIKKGKAKNIITLTGAGISTSAGIPDFRSPTSGLYANLQKYDLPYPQAIFELDFFKKNPEPFFTLARTLFPGEFKPTPCHYFIKLLSEKELLLRHYTQNIDTLERVAGIKGDAIVEAHGTMYTAHCLNCNKEYSLEWLKEKIFLDDVPCCTECIGVVKPDIVFFGESLPQKFFQSAKTDFPKCDLLIIMGTSLEVQPFASLIDRVRENCPRILINREKTGNCDRLIWMLGMQSGLDFDSETNNRDVAWLGDCDEGCQLLADKLGWGDELRELVRQEHTRIEEEISVRHKEARKKKKIGRISKGEQDDSADQ